MEQSGQIAETEPTRTLPVGGPGLFCALSHHTDVLGWHVPAYHHNTALGILGLLSASVTDFLFYSRVKKGLALV